MCFEGTLQALKAFSHSLSDHCCSSQSRAQEVGYQHYPTANSSNSKNKQNSHSPFLPEDFPKIKSLTLPICSFPNFFRALSRQATTTNCCQVLQPLGHSWLIIRLLIKPLRAAAADLRTQLSPSVGDVLLLLILIK